jgi:HEAT repeat protein
MFVKYRILVGLSVLLCLVCGCRPAKPKISINQLPQDLCELVSQCHSPDLAQQIDAIKKIGEMHEQAAQAVPFLLELLEDKDFPYGLNRAAYFELTRSLVKIGPSVIEPCIDAMQAAPKRYRRQLMKIISQFEDRRAIDALAACLEYRRMEDRRVIGALAAYLSDADSAEDAAYFLGKQKAPWLIPCMTELQENECNDLAPSAWDFLARQKLAGTDAEIDQWLQTVQDINEIPDARGRAMNSIERLSVVKAAPLLLQIAHDRVKEEEEVVVGNENFFRRSELSYLRKHALQVLRSISEKSIPDKQDVRPLMDIVLDETEDVSLRISAILCLPVLAEDETVVAPLVGLLDKLRTGMTKTPSVVLDPRPKTIVGCLHDIGGPESVAALKDIALNPAQDLLVRCWAAYWVADILDGKVDDIAFVELLEQRFESPLYLIKPIHGGKHERDSVYPGEYDVEVVKKALNKIVKNGKTDAIRARAKQAIPKVMKYPRAPGQSSP